MTQLTVDEIAQVMADAYPYAADRWSRLGETQRDEWRLAAVAIINMVTEEHASVIDDYWRRRSLSSWRLRVERAAMLVEVDEMRGPNEPAA